MPEYPNVALIIPAYNEAPVLGLMLDRLPTSLFPSIVVADNGSTDGTAQVASEHGAIVVRIPEPGYGAACLAALDVLPRDVDTLVFLQADASEDPAEIPAVLRPILQGSADLVIGSRVHGRIEPGGLLPHQRAGNRLATWMIAKFWGFAYTDLGPFRAIRRSALERLQLRELRYGWTVEMQIRAVEEGLAIEEVPVSTGLRAAGSPKVAGNPVASVRAAARIIWTILRLAYRRHSASRKGTPP